jgi:membrane-associated PAP2 superfamily phosphatase
MNRIISVIIVLMVLVANYSAQTGIESTTKLIKDSTFVSGKDSTVILDKPAEQMPKWHEFITNIPSDFSRYFQLTFREDKIPLYMTVAATTAALWATDAQTWKDADKMYKTNKFIHNFSYIFTQMGDGKTQFGLAGVFGIYGLVFNDVKAVRTGSQILEAILASGALVQVFKHVTGRQSPSSSSMPGGSWTFFPNQVTYAKRTAEYDAYPSGHVTTTLATVIVIAENYPDVWWIRPLGYTITGCLAFGMVNYGIHWYSDYPLALVFGYTFGMLAAHPDEIPNIIAGKKLKGNFAIMPILTDKGFGIGAGYSF